MKRLPVKRIVVCLFLGVVTTVAVAWGCGAFIDLTAQDDFKQLGRTSREVPCWLLWSAPGTGGSIICAIELQTTEDATSIPARGSLIVLPGSDSIPSWSQFTNEANARTTGQPRFRVEMALGWPVRALSCEFEAGWYGDDSAGPITITNGIRVGHFLRSTHMGERVLPLKPIWFGLMTDVVLHGVIWFLIVSGLIALRRTLRSRFRLRHGLCIHCKYDLRGSAGSERCPECGAEIRRVKRVGE